MMQSTVENRLDKGSEQGFSLIEVMVSLVVAMTILAGLFLTFITQNGEYKYQNKRIDTVQDLEFGIKFIEEDLRSALVGAESISITPDAVDLYTSVLTFSVWDRLPECASCRVGRIYKYDSTKKMLRYDRESSFVSTREILPNVTFFKVFDDYSSAFDTTAERGGVYSGMPDALPLIQVNGPDGAVDVHGYTILIEMEVDAGYKGGKKENVFGEVVSGKRIWRYSQVYPLAAVN